ncbi:ankyrin repeat and SAM domain-containing protein 3-like isoform X2 [Ornithodoros turicata]
MHLNLRNKDLWTPLMYAACSGYSEILELLLRYGTDVNAVNIQGQTATVLAAMYGNKDTVHLLLKFGADREVRDTEGHTALFHAVAHGHSAVVQTLLDAGANVNCVDKSGVSPLTIACAARHENVVALLLRAGAKFGAGGTNAQLHSHLHQGVHPREIGHNQQMTDLVQMCQNITLRNRKTTVSQYAIPKHEIHTLDQLFHYLDITKYLPVFEKEGIDLSQFLKLTESDLEAIGIRLVGPRMKMTRAIASWNV